MSETLGHIKVLEVASVLAGPAVGMFFAERGARVCKIENQKTGGDVTRSWKLASEEPDSSLSAYYSSVNWHKEVLFLDLGSEEHRPQIEGLIKEADILIANFKFGDAKKFNLDFDSVRKINPLIIHAELSGFGADESRVAYDLVLQAETGFMYMNGTPTSGPVKMPLAMIDILAAHQLKEGILEALVAQSSNPKAYHVETSLYDAALASLYNQGSNYLMAGHIPEPIGSLHPNIAPYGELFETKDGQQITLAVGSDTQFNKLTEVLGLEQDDRFTTNKLRVENRAAFPAYLGPKIKEWTADDLCTRLIAQNIPVAQVKNLKQVFENDKARKLILEEEIDGVATSRVKTAVYKITSA